MIDRYREFGSELVRTEMNDRGRPVDLEFLIRKPDSLASPSNRDLQSRFDGAQPAQGRLPSPVGSSCSRPGARLADDAQPGSRATPSGSSVVTPRGLSDSSHIRRRYSYTATPSCRPVVVTLSTIARKRSPRRGLTRVRHLAPDHVRAQRSLGEVVGQRHASIREKGPQHRLSSEQVSALVARSRLPLLLRAALELPSQSAAQPPHTPVMLGLADLPSIEPVTGSYHRSSDQLQTPTELAARTGGAPPIAAK